MHWSIVGDNFHLLLHGLGTTLLLSLAAIGMGTAIGLLAAVLRTSRLPVLAQLSRIYVEIFRGSPLLITLLFVYFGASYLGYVVNIFYAGVLGLSIYEGAYLAEIFRAGLEAVPRGQREAASVLGLSKPQTFWQVVLPQTRTIVLPPLIGQYIALIKDSSLVIVIGLVELTRQGQAIVDRAGQPLPIYLTVAGLYFVICYPLSLLVRLLERRARYA
jgi:polar amino acid transport system permease protein